MSGVPSKYPKKKRRLDASQEPQPGSSSGGNVQPAKRHLKRGKKGQLSCPGAKSGLPITAPSPGFVKASEILKAEHSRSCSSSSEDEGKQLAKRSSKFRPPRCIKTVDQRLKCEPEISHPSSVGDGSKSARSCLREGVFGPKSPLENCPSPGFVKASEISGGTASTSQARNHLREEEAFDSKIPLEDCPSPGFVKASEISRVHDASTSQNCHQERAFSPKSPLEDCPSPGFVKASEMSGASTSFLPENPASALSGNRSEVNSKQQKSRIHNKRKKPSVDSFKITHYFNREAALEALRESKKFLRELQRKRSLAEKAIALRSADWETKNEDLLETITDNELFFKRYRDRYGLVENAEEDDAGVDYFSHLPTHIIELILCTVPILDFLNCRRVCKRWMAIIDNQRYMKWKKLYYKYKKDDCDKEIVMQGLLAPYNHQPVDSCVATIVNYMGKEFNRVHSTDMYDRLLQNAHGELADHVLSERFPQFNGKDSRVWCQLAVAVLISETVWDVLRLYRTLLAVRSNCLRTDIHDALYCFALFLFHFRCKENINCGLHYRVYYALYLIENSIPLCQRGKVKRIQNIPGQQNIQNYGESENSSLTYEQIRILNHRFELDQKIKIVALAGSGKTTTLVHLARLYPQIKFLNIVFNRSVNREARKKFPPNVVCKTAHAMAYAAVGKELRHKLCTVLGPSELAGHVTCNVDRLPALQYSKLVLSTLSHFMHSREGQVGLFHVPSRDPQERILSYLNRERILSDARAIWEKMSDKGSEVRISHDVYLKLYQLERPRWEEFQCVMVDEAQDCNPAILDIVLSQRIPVILVGDPHQQIYSFRGAKNALKMTQATHTYSLTKSFRFGPEISYIASCVLEVSLNVTDNVLVGNTADSNLRGESCGQFAVIARSNMVLFNEAVRMVVLKRLKPYEPQTVQPFFAGGLASYRFDQMEDIYTLKFHNKGERKFRDRFIGQFKSLHDLHRYTELTNDTDLKAKIELVNQHGHQIPEYLRHLRQRCCPAMDTATVVFSTVHKSKGLEFDTVCLTDDYVISPITGEQSREEANILYVAITRAKKCLLLPEKVTKLLHAAHEKFEYPVCSKSLSVHQSGELRCVQCDAAFVPHTVLALVRRKIVMAGGRETSSGVLCMKCRSDPSMRPDLHLNGLVMYLDPVPDNAHRLMGALVGPLPSDPPILHDRFSAFGDADRVFVINLNIQ